MAIFYHNVPRSLQAVGRYYRSAFCLHHQSGRKYRSQERYLNCSILKLEHKKMNFVIFSVAILFLDSEKQRRDAQKFKFAQSTKWLISQLTARCTRRTCNLPPRQKVYNFQGCIFHEKPTVVLLIWSIILKMSKAFLSWKQK